mgnify:CR=1 FL=1
MISHARSLPRRLMMTASAIVMSVAIAPAKSAMGLARRAAISVQATLQKMLTTPGPAAIAPPK